MRVSEIAGRLGASFEGDGERHILRAAPVDRAGTDDIAFAANARALRDVAESAAGCLLVPTGFDNAAARTVIRLADPRAGFAKLLTLLHPPPARKPGIHPTAVVDVAAHVAADVEIGPYVVVGEGCRIGRGTQIGAGTILGRNVLLGEDNLLHAGVRIYDDVETGARVILHSGCVLGADGFGFAREGGAYVKFPQVGRVRIGDDVEIGANSCVDRAALGATEIGNGTKLDNMVHVGHNSRIGANVVIAAQTGISGGAIIADNVVVAGQVGIADKVRVEEGAVLGAKCGIPSGKIIRRGETVWGIPARPLKEYLQQLAHLAHLGDLRKEVAELKKKSEPGKQ